MVCGGVVMESDYKLTKCDAAAFVLNTDVTDCNKCPFPFCVTSELGRGKAVIREHMTMLLQKLGQSVQDMANTLDVTTRSVSRYKYYDVHHVNPDCEWCTAIHSKDVLCKSTIYTIIHKDGKYLAILNEHRTASVREAKSIELFIDYVFPAGLYVRQLAMHEYWEVTKYEQEEVRNFNQMCNALDRYTMSKVKEGDLCPVA
jgi:hypothetical protein